MFFEFRTETPLFQSNQTALPFYNKDTCTSSSSNFTMTNQNSKSKVLRVQFTCKLILRTY